MKLTFKKKLLALLLVMILPALAACADDKNKDNTNDNEAKTSEEKTDKEDKKDKNNESAEAEKAEELGAFEGNIPYDFELVSFQDGKTYKLYDYLGKQPIIIKFFASWCGPCRMEMPELEEVYQDYQEDGLMVFAVNLGAGDSEEDVEQIISDYLLTYPVLKDEKSDVAFEYGIRSIPVNIFIGKDGVIKKHLVGMQSKESYEENVMSLLEEK